MTKKRRSHDHLIFIMEIPILVLDFPLYKITGLVVKYVISNTIMLEIP